MLRCPQGATGVRRTTLYHISHVACSRPSRRPNGLRFRCPFAAVIRPMTALMLSCTLEVAQIGIEITEANPQRFAAMCALAEKELPFDWIPVDLFPWDAETLSKDEMRDLLRKDTRSPPAGSAMRRRKIVNTLFMSGVVGKQAAQARRGWLPIVRPELACQIDDNLPLPQRQPRGRNQAAEAVGGRDVGFCPGVQCAVHRAWPCNCKGDCRCVGAFRNPSAHGAPRIRV